MSSSGTCAMRLECHPEAQRMKVVEKKIRCFSSVQIRFTRSIVSRIVLIGPSGGLAIR
jgi:hypothetical protein